MCLLTQDNLTHGVNWLQVICTGASTLSALLPVSARRSACDCFLPKERILFLKITMVDSVVSTIVVSSNSLCIWNICVQFLGNTVLHMLVIHNKIDMFDLVLSMSNPGLLNIPNNKGKAQQPTIRLYLLYQLPLS